MALRYARDQYHQRARTLLRKLRGDGLGLVTTEWVMAEAVRMLRIPPELPPGQRVVAMGEQPKREGT